MTGDDPTPAPGMAQFIERSTAIFPDDTLDRPLAEQRARYRALCRAFATARPPGLEIREESLTVGGFEVGLRVYRPAGAGSQAGIVYFHGGGWIYGDLDSHDSVTADLAAKTSATVIAVDYGLAPEHPYPQPVEHCYGALRHVAAQAGRYGIDPARLAVAGDSAGGTLAVATALKARDEKGPALAGQGLIYPSIGLDLIEDRRCGQAEVPMLSSEDMQYYARAYLGGATTTTEPYAAPVLAESYAGLPPAYVLAVELDPLAEDARIYAERLRAEAVAVELRIVEGLVHGCLRARQLCPAAAAAFDDFSAALAAMLAD